MQVISAAAPPRNQHPLPSPPEGGRRMRVDQLEPGHQLRGAEEPRRPTADADGEETAARAADGRAGRRHAADRRREEQTSRAGLWIRRMLVLDQASSHGCSHCSLTSLVYSFILRALLMQMEHLTVAARFFLGWWEFARDSLAVRQNGVTLEQSRKLMSVARWDTVFIQ